MASVEIIETRDLANSGLFLSIAGNLPHTAAKRQYFNARYRTLGIEEYQNFSKLSGKPSAKKFLHIIQLAKPKYARELQLKFPDETAGIAPSVVAKVLDLHQGKLGFGLGDIRPGAPFLYWSEKDTKDISEMVKWMRENLSDNVLAIRHKYLLRASFADENDFVLTRLRWT